MKTEAKKIEREDIIRMAREAGLHLPYWDDEQDPKKDPPRWTMVSPLPPLLERFAALVAAAEREACAKVCEAQENKVVVRYPARIEFDPDSMMARKCAAAIRARREA